MRKITKQAIGAFTNGENFSSGNTRVSFNDKTGEGLLLLHDNIIAKMDCCENIEVSLAGYNTKVTKERLNGIPGVSIHSVKGVPFLNGEVIEDDKFYTI